MDNDEPQTSISFTPYQWVLICQSLHNREEYLDGMDSPYIIYATEMYELRGIREIIEDVINP